MTPLGQANALDKKYPEAIASYKQAAEADPAAAVSVARMAKAYSITSSMTTPSVRLIKYWP